MLPSHPGPPVIRRPLAVTIVWIPTTASICVAPAPHAGQRSTDKPVLEQRHLLTNQPRLITWAFTVQPLLNKTAENGITPLALPVPLPACLLAHVRLNLASACFPPCLGQPRSTSRTRALVSDVQDTPKAHNSRSCSPFFFPSPFIQPRLTGTL